MKTIRLKPKKVNDMAERKKVWQKLCNIVGFTIPLDGIISAASNNIHIDLFKLEQRIPNYDSVTCKYRDSHNKRHKNYSMSMAVEAEWGKEAVELINKLL